MPPAGGLCDIVTDVPPAFPAVIAGCIGTSGRESVLQAAGFGGGTVAKQQLPEFSGMLWFGLWCTADPRLSRSLLTEGPCICCCPQAKEGGPTGGEIDPEMCRIAGLTRRMMFGKVTVALPTRALAT